MEMRRVFFALGGKKPTHFYLNRPVLKRVMVFKVPMFQIIFSTYVGIQPPFLLEQIHGTIQGLDEKRREIVK
jgi:hypothetical protein